jgi:hypothetical protein
MQLLNAPIRAYFGFREERIVSLFEHALETQEKFVEVIPLMRQNVPET